MKINKLIGLMVTEEINDKLRAYAKKYNTSIADVARDALGRYLKITKIRKIKEVEEVERQEFLNEFQEELHRLFEYKDGKLFWKASRGRVRRGNRAGAFLKNRTDEVVYINKKQYRVHQIIYCLHHGIIPKYTRFIDGNRKNNRIENLCAVNTAREAALHSKPARHNKSGFKGVSWTRSSRKWVAIYKTKDKKTKRIGLFDDPREAYEAYCKAIKEEYGVDINSKQ